MTPSRPAADGECASSRHPHRPSVIRQRNRALRGHLEGPRRTTDTAAPAADEMHLLSEDARAAAVLMPRRPPSPTECVDPPPWGYARRPRMLMRLPVGWDWHHDEFRA